MPLQRLWTLSNPCPGLWTKRPSAMIPRSQPYDMIREFLRLESAGGILLVIATVFALILANSALGGVYEGFLRTPVVIQVGALEIAKPLLLWINDGLMAIFFFLVGLEIKRIHGRRVGEPAAGRAAGHCGGRRNGCAGADLCRDQCR